MASRLSGKVAIITGGGGGIGSSIGELFCSEGACVLLVDRDNNSVTETANRIRKSVSGARLEVFVGDIGDYEQVTRAVARAVETFGGLSVLINNAALRDETSIEKTEGKVWNDLLSVNLLGAVNFCKASVKELRKSGNASVINVSSVYGLMGRKHWAIYDASKAALLSLTRTFACEEADSGIRVNAICVSSALTPFTIKRAYATRKKTEEELLREVKIDNLLQRWAHPKEIAYPILWLASDEASFITGTTMMVDGGKSIL